MTARSFLFVPGNRPERFDKAWAAGADAVILDLEDAVALHDKAAARSAVAGWLSPARPVWLRINGAESDQFPLDLPLLGRPGVAGVVVAKAEQPATLQEVHRHADGRPVVPLIESGLGLHHLMALAKVAGVQRFAFGSIDFQLDLGITGEREELLFARSQLVLVSRVAGLAPPIDGVTLALDDPQALADDVARARRMGFGGKLSVHPKQVAGINLGFLPPASEVAWARQVVEAAGAVGDNAVRVDGKLVDRPIIDRARAVLQAVAGAA